MRECIRLSFEVSYIYSSSSIESRAPLPMNGYEIGQNRICSIPKNSVVWRMENGYMHAFIQTLSCIYTKTK